MPKSLADGHVKLTLLITKPANPALPTATELNAGIQAACRVLASDFEWSAADSDKVAEKALCEINNANSLGPSNYTAGLTVFRYFDATTGAPSTAEDTLFAALMNKGAELWGYNRKNGKLESAPWAANDEIPLGLHIITDVPQDPKDQGGYIKYRIPLEPQAGWSFIKAGPVTP